MEPTLTLGCSILVDRSRRRRRVGGIFVVRTGKDKSGSWLLMCDRSSLATSSIRCCIAASFTCTEAYRYLCIRVVYNGVMMAAVSTGGDKKTGARSVRMSVSFDVDDYAEIKGIAKKKRVSAAWVVRDAVISYLNAQTPLFASDRRGNV